MILTLIWAFLAISLLVACVSAYFYWFAGKTAIWNMMGFYLGTALSIFFFILIILARVYLFIT